MKTTTPLDLAGVAVARALVGLVPHTVDRALVRALARVAQNTAWYHTVRSVARPLLGLPSSTLLSRLARAELPSLKVLLVDLRLCVTATVAVHLPPNATGLALAFQAGWPSDQALGRHVRQYRGVTLRRWRDHVGPRTELMRFLDHFDHHPERWANIARPATGHPHGE